MAFTADVTASTGRTLTAAYCRVIVHSADKTSTTVLIQVWKDASDRTEHPSSPVQEFEQQHILKTVDVDCHNPLDYGYKLLESSGLYPEATWNV